MSIDELIAAQGRMRDLHAQVTDGIAAIARSGAQSVPYFLSVTVSQFLPQVLTEAARLRTGRLIFIIDEGQEAFAQVRDVGPGTPSSSAAPCPASRPTRCTAKR